MSQFVRVLLLLIFTCSVTLPQRIHPSENLPTAGPNSASNSVDLRPILPVDEIIRLWVNVQKLEDRALERYAWYEHLIESRSDRYGLPRVFSDKTWDVSEVNSIEYRRLIERNGVPLSGEQQSKEDRKYARFLHKQRQRTAVDARQPDPAREERRRHEEHILDEVPQAFNFSIRGMELRIGGPAYEIEASPRPDFQPKNICADVLKNMSGTLWINATAFELVQLDLAIQKPVSVAVILLRLQQGRYHLAQQPVIDGHWFPVEEDSDFSARFLGMPGEFAAEASYYRYRKFRVETRFLLLAEGG